MVKQQVASQIKVRDFSQTKITIAPAEFSSWQEARTELMSERKRGLRAEMEAELGAVQGENAEATKSEADKLRVKFNLKEREVEHEIDHVRGWDSNLRPLSRLSPPLNVIKAARR